MLLEKNNYVWMVLCWCVCTKFNVVISAQTKWGSISFVCKMCRQASITTCLAIEDRSFWKLWRWSFSFRLRRITYLQIDRINMPPHCLPDTRCLGQVYNSLNNPGTHCMWPDLRQLCLISSLELSMLLPMRAL